jgi:hypothetical protein
VKYIDLELYRWRFHHDIYMKRKSSVISNSNNYCNKSYCTYWKEIGAFVSVLPRQSGKSMMLTILAKEFAKNNENFIIVVSHDQMRRQFISNGISRENVVSIYYALDHMLNASTVYHNLMIDEFNCIKRDKIDEILNRDWKTVTMVGTI